ncbi:hypothetical protein [Microbacterium hydrocarbonoxydans]|nr:hypothetical protein [Microbacterium hydrocarbonoxydans]
MNENENADANDAARTDWERLKALNPVTGITMSQTFDALGIDEEDVVSALSGKMITFGGPNPEVAALHGHPEAQAFAASANRPSRHGGTPAPDEIDADHRLREALAAEDRLNDPWSD